MSPSRWSVARTSRSLRDTARSRAFGLRRGGNQTADMASLSGNVIDTVIKIINYIIES